MTTDEWVEAALTDDAVVVELLFRLKQSSESFASPPAKPPPPPHRLVIPISWGYRQPRSKPLAGRKDRDSTRCSPTTPLSWSCCSGGSASHSDGCDESSRRSDLSSSGRSKGISCNETTAATTTTTNKRSRRRKSFAELKEEESLLLEERIHLNKELATLCSTIKEQKARSESLKRIKLDLHLQSANKMASGSDEMEGGNGQPNLAKVSCFYHVSGLPAKPMQMHQSDPAYCEEEKEADLRGSCFILPDLNMTPIAEDAGCETL